MKGVIFEKRGLSLVPIDEAGVELIEQFPNGKRLVVHAHAPVNEKHYRLWWALANKIVRSGAWGGNRETFKDWLLMRTGRMRTVIDPETGKAFFVAQSLSIDAFDDNEFREWFDLAVQVCCEKLLARQDYAWLRNELLRSVEMRNPYYARQR